MRAVIKLYVRAFSALELGRARIMSAVRYSDDDNNSAIGSRHYVETILLCDAVRTAECMDYCTLESERANTFTGF